MPSQDGLSATPSLSRRGFMRSCLGATAATTLATSGCISSAQSNLPELVWGRRGLGEGRFLKPRAITIDNLDQLYIVDTTGRIQVFDTNGNLIRAWRTPETANGRPTGLAFQPAEARPQTDPSGQPHGQSKDGQEEVGPEDRSDHVQSGGADEPAKPRLLVADTHYYRMLSYTTDGELQQQEQIGGNAGHLPGQFAFVTDAVSAGNGEFYVGEYNASDRIQKFAPNGEFITQWGGNGKDPGKFVRPQSLEIRNDVLWVADSCNHRIQRFDIREEQPRLIDVWGGPGTGPGQFYYPYDLAIASDDTVIVVEYKNNRIQRFAPDGKWIASWGSPGFEAGRLNQPWGVVIDSQDRVHILDSNNHRVQRLAELPS